MAKTNAELWAMVAASARQEHDWKKVWNDVRREGGRDLAKDDNEFQMIYERFLAQPLFSAQWCLNERRLAFQQLLATSMWELDPADDDEVDLWVGTIAEFGKGSFMALLSAIDTIRVKRPTLADSLEATARTLHPRPFKEIDDRKAAAAQLELPLQPEQQLDGAVPAVP